MSIKYDIKMQIKALRDMDISTNPNYRTILALKKVLVEKGMEEEMATKLVTTMKIEVNENFVNDEEFMIEILEDMSQIITNINVQCKKDGIGDFIYNAAQGLELEMNI